MSHSTGWPSSVKYKRLPTSVPGAPSQDDVAFDFSSPFSFKSVFTYSKAVPPYMLEERKYDPSLLTRICTVVVVVFSCVFTFLTFPITAFFVIKVVEQFERLVVFRLGRLQPPKGPGVVFVLPFVDKSRRVDMRTRAFNVPPQQLITVDGAAVSVGAAVFFRTTDVSLSIASVQNLNHATRTLGQTIMVSALSSRSLKVIENDKSIVNQLIQDEMNLTTKHWGIEVSRVELSEVTVVQQAVEGVSLDQLGSIFNQLVSGGQETSPLSNLLQAITPPTNRTPTTPTLLPPTQYPSPKQQTPLTNATSPLGSSPDRIVPSDLLALVTPFINRDLVEEIGAVFRFVIRGDDGGVFYLDLKNGCGDAGSGEPHHTPDVTLTMSASDLHAMFTGQIGPYMGYMTGRLAVEGDRAAAMKLDAILQRMQAFK